MTWWNWTFFKNSRIYSVPRLKTLVKTLSQNSGQNFSQSNVHQTHPSTHPIKKFPLVGILPIFTKWCAWAPIWHAWDRTYILKKNNIQQVPLHISYGESWKYLLMISCLICFSFSSRAATALSEWGKTVGYISRTYIPHKKAIILNIEPKKIWEIQFQKSNPKKKSNP